MPAQAELAGALLTAERPAPAGLLPSARFAVHRNNVVAGLVEALGVAYPAVRSLVGEPFFRAAATVFVCQEPPRSPVLIDYGSGFPGFLEAFPPAAGLPYLASVARLERAWLTAYHAAEATPLAIAALGQVAETELDQVRLVLHPSLRLVESIFPIIALWAANTGRGPHGAVDLGRAESALVVRPEERVMVESLSPGMAAFVGTLADDRALGMAAEAALRAEPGLTLGPALGRLFALGAVVALRQSSCEGSDR